MILWSKHLTLSIRAIVRINKNTVIYILAPANHATGGPELLHQLAYHLNQQGLNAAMYYLPSDHSDPVHPAYSRYDIAFSREIIDHPDNILIVPEYIACLLDKYADIQKIVWWLSVDNYYSYENHGRFRKQKRKINEFLNNIGFFNSLFFDSKLKNIDLHLVQSHYAEVFLEKHKVNNIKYLSDYLNDDFLRIETSYDMKEDIIAYNPTKGYEFTKQIMDYDSLLKFVPIQNMSREEVIELLQKAKVYIDFGNHPGKDRIPREAAMLNCCVIVGRRGSARYREDVDIDEKYKFDESKKNIPNITAMIRQCFQDYENEVQNFISYKNSILNEKAHFVEDVKKVFE